MINLHTGELVIDHHYKLHPNLSFSNFKSSPYYKNQNEERLFSIGGPYPIDKRKYYISLLFKNGLLHQVRLIAVDDQISKWEDEPNRKDIHDQILLENGINKESYPFGRITSIFDRKGYISSIFITYDNSLE